MAGDRGMVSVTGADEIRQMIPGARLAIVPGDHGVPMEKPALVAPPILDHLAELATSR